MPNSPWPVELTVPAARDRVRITYDDDTVHELSAEFLRVQTPSAERKGHGSRVVVGGKRGVAVARIEPVGRYAVRIVFDDGHSTGLYSFDYLREIGADKARLWDDYLGELAAAGLSRDRPGTAPAP